MKAKPTTYRILKKAVAVFLITGILLPSALQAKQLVDFCMMEMNHHEMMDDSHDCCLADAKHHPVAKEKGHNCENGQICACPVDEAPEDNQFRVPTTHSAGIILSQTGFNFSITSPDEIIYKDFFAAAKQDSPPLYLLYDTFLN